MSVKAVATLTEPAVSTCTIAPICATPCVSRTTPDTAAVEAALQIPDANVSIRAPSPNSLPNLIQLRCTVRFTLCVDLATPNERAAKIGPSGHSAPTFDHRHTIRVIVQPVTCAFALSFTPPSALALHASASN